MSTEGEGQPSAGERPPDNSGVTSGDFGQPEFAPMRDDRNPHGHQRAGNGPGRDDERDEPPPKESVTPRATLYVEDVTRWEETLQNRGSLSRTDKNSINEALSISGGARVPGGRDMTYTEKIALARERMAAPEGTMGYIEPRYRTPPEEVQAEQPTPVEEAATALAAEPGGGEEAAPAEAVAEPIQLATEVIAEIQKAASGEPYNALVFNPEVRADLLNRIGQPDLVGEEGIAVLGQKIADREIVPAEPAPLNQSAPEQSTEVVEVDENAAVPAAATNGVPAPITQAPGSGEADATEEPAIEAAAESEPSTTGFEPPPYRQMEDAEKLEIQNRVIGTKAYGHKFDVEGHTVQWTGIRTDASFSQEEATRLRELARTQGLGAVNQETSSRDPNSYKFIFEVDNGKPTREVVSGDLDFFYRLGAADEKSATPSKPGTPELIPVPSPPTPEPRSGAVGNEPPKMPEGGPPAEPPLGTAEAAPGGGGSEDDDLEKAFQERMAEAMQNPAVYEGRAGAEIPLISAQLYDRMHTQQDLYMARFGRLNGTKDPVVQSILLLKDRQDFKSAPDLKAAHQMLEAMKAGTNDPILDPNGAQLKEIEDLQSGIVESLRGGRENLMKRTLGQISKITVEGRAEQKASEMRLKLALLDFDDTLVELSKAGADKDPAGEILRRTLEPRRAEIRDRIHTRKTQPNAGGQPTAERQTSLGAAPLARPEAPRPAGAAPERGTLPEDDREFMTGLFNAFIQGAQEAGGKWYEPSVLEKIKDNSLAVLRRFHPEKEKDVNDQVEKLAKTGWGKKIGKTLLLLMVIWGIGIGISAYSAFKEGK